MLPLSIADAAHEWLCFGCMGRGVLCRVGIGATRGVATRPVLLSRHGIIFGIGCGAAGRGHGEVTQPHIRHGLIRGNAGLEVIEAHGWQEAERAAAGLSVLLCVDGFAEAVATVLALQVRVEIGLAGAVGQERAVNGGGSSTRTVAGYPGVCSAQGTSIYYRGCTPL